MMLFQENWTHGLFTWENKLYKSPLFLLKHGVKNCNLLNALRTAIRGILFLQGVQVTVAFKIATVL